MPDQQAGLAELPRALEYATTGAWLGLPTAPPPFRLAVFQPPSRSFLKPTPRHSDYISKVPGSCTALLNHPLLVVEAAVPTSQTCFL